MSPCVIEFAVSPANVDSLATALRLSQSPKPSDEGVPHSYLSMFAELEKRTKWKPYGHDWPEELLFSECCRH
jgi:hypothetical protein